MSQATVTPLGASPWGPRKVSFSLDACHDHVPLLRCLSGAQGSGAGGCPGCHGEGAGTTPPRGDTPLSKRGGVSWRGGRGERSELRPSKSRWLAASGREGQTGRQDLTPRRLCIRVGLPWSLGDQRRQLDEQPRSGRRPCILLQRGQWGHCSQA